MVSLNLSPLDRATLSISFSDYQCFRQLVEEAFGLSYPDARRPELEMTVRTAFASSTSPDLKQYSRLLRDPIFGSLERERLANRLTAGEENFFNDPAQFDALERTILPEIIERRRAVRRLRIWIAGCASGEAPYSIAMLLQELMPDIAQWEITLLGTDINMQALAYARRGVYGAWAFQQPRARAYRSHYFTALNRGYELTSTVRNMVRFSRLNLVQDSYPSCETDTLLMDLILCPGLDGAFTEAAAQAMTSKFFAALVEGGWLITKTTESNPERYSHFQPREFPGMVAYQRLSETPRTQETMLNPPPAAVTGMLASSLPISAAARAELPRPTAGPLKVASEKPAARLGTAELRLFGDNEYEQALALVNFGRMDQARDLLLRWLTLHPSDALACTQIARAYASLGNWPEAERWCQIAVTIEPSSQDALYTLALIRLHQGHLHQAIKLMKKAANIDREDLLTNYSLACLYNQNQQLPQALKYLAYARRILENRPLSEPVPRAGDLTTGRLAQTVIELQQAWAQAATGQAAAGSAATAPEPAEADGAVEIA